MTDSRWDQRRGRRLVLPAVLLSCLLAGSGCAGGGPATSGPVPSSSAASAQPAETGRADVPADVGLPTAVPAVESGPAAVSAALATAEAAVTAFTRRDLEPGRWWDGVLPFLSPQAAQAYAGTDPALVPAGEVVDEPTAGPSPSEHLAVVAVPTDAGMCSVLLSRSDDATGWQVERISWAAAGTGPG